MSLTQFLLIVHLLCITSVIGIGLSNIVGFRVARGLGADQAAGLAAHREALLPYADGFFVVLLLSGLGLLWAIGGPATLPFWFHLKMAAVVVWAISYILMRLRIRRIMATRDMSLIGLVRTYAHIGITGAVLAVIFAVMTFAA